MTTFAQLPIKDAYLIVVNRPKDKRGYFNELYNENVYFESIRGSIAGDWKQVALSQTEHVNTIRGLHMSPYNKLCAVLSGAIYDVIVDMRPSSPTFLMWCGTYLSEANRRQVHIPAQCLHGFLSLETNTRMLYLQGGTFTPDLERDCNPFDPLLAVQWPLLEGSELIISDKDRNAPLATHASRFPDLATRPPMTRVLIVGASGQIGAALVDEYRRLGYAVYGTHFDNPPPTDFMLTVRFDLAAAAESQILVDELIGMSRPNIVIICGAETAADRMESDRKRATAVNVDGTRMLAVAASKAGAKVVVYSSGSIWDGSAGPYTEEEPPKPLNVYGESKATMEHTLSSIDSNILILRTSFVYGPEVEGKNLVYELRKRLTSSQSVGAAIDQIIAPTYNRDVAFVTRILLDKGASGVFNVCGTERMSEYDFAVMIANILGLSRDLIKAVQTSELNQKAKRPLNGVMNIDKLISIVGSDFTPRGVKGAMRDWLETPGTHSLPLESVVRQADGHATSSTASNL